MAPANQVVNPPPYWILPPSRGLRGLHSAKSVGGQGFSILELAIVLAEFGLGGYSGAVRAFGHRRAC